VTLIWKNSCSNGMVNRAQLLQAEGVPCPGRCGGDLAGARRVNTEIAAELAMIARCP